jgi:hypothetical protein
MKSDFILADKLKDINNPQPRILYLLEVYQNKNSLFPAYILANWLEEDKVFREIGFEKWLVDEEITRKWNLTSIIGLGGES